VDQVSLWVRCRLWAAAGADDGFVYDDGVPWARVSEAGFPSPRTTGGRPPRVLAMMGTTCQTEWSVTLKGVGAFTSEQPNSGRWWRLQGPELHARPCSALSLVDIDLTAGLPLPQHGVVALGHICGPWPIAAVPRHAFTGELGF